MSSKANFKRVNAEDDSNASLVEKYQVKSFPRLVFTDNTGKAYINQGGAPASAQGFTDMITRFLGEHGG
jgi:thioredoxin-related protein